MTDSEKPITIALAELSVEIAWCLAWGEQRKPQFDLSVLQQMRQALNNGTAVPEEVRSLVEQVQQLETLDFPKTLDELKQLTEEYPTLWNSKIGLVYGGATKIKQYVFESAKFPEIRGASALLDRINLVDIPAFFDGTQRTDSVLRFLENFPELESALIKELIIRSTGAVTIAFCPAALVNDLADAIEKRYTQETLTANSCAVGDTFRPLEICFGLLQNKIDDTPWLEWYLQNREKPLVKSYFEQPGINNPQEAFQKRKNFNELVGKLTVQFNQRRNGNDKPESNRPSRRYPPMFETHPYLIRDDNTRASAVVQAGTIPGQPWLSEPLARKRVVGLVAKRTVESNKLPKWYTKQFTWKPEFIEDWVTKFNDEFLNESPEYKQNYYRYKSLVGVEAAQSLTEIGDASNGFVAYIYADGNNMGGYIQNSIQSPEEYRRFSKDIFEATKNSVYIALAKYLEPHQLQNLDPDDESTHKNGQWIHPFEILMLGGDDVLIIVPADKALDIAKTIGDEFERILIDKGHYKSVSSRNQFHRYKGETPPTSHCELSTSIGVLITAYNTPIYYAKKLYEQLLKSAKKRARDLKDDYQYHGGTIDFLTMKSVTMISSNIETFRKEGLTKQRKGQPTLKLYAAPYTLHELGGLLKTAEALKKSEFPRSQLYQIRSLLEQGKHMAILNYRYFRVRLQLAQQKLLAEWFEKAWCQAKTNDGNIAPWMSILSKSSSELLKKTAKKQNPRPSSPSSQEVSTYETIWHELVDIYPFINEPARKQEKEVSQ